MRSRWSIALAAALAVASAAGTAAAHCQVPCGIYDDHARVDGLLEDATTIARAVDQVTQLAGKGDAQSLNQATRWITTKEAHADRIISTVAEYFLTQKIKPADSKDPKAWATYQQLLADHHAVMVLAMKTKQTVDPKVVGELRVALEKMGAHWPPAAQAKK